MLKIIKTEDLFFVIQSALYTHIKKLDYSLHTLMYIKIKLYNLNVQVLIIIKLNPIIMFLNPTRIVIVQITTTRAAKHRDRMTEDRNSISNVPPPP